MALPWRNCYASVVLLNEINALNPSRDRSSDGTIGDAAHATRASDHNPWVTKDGMGIVRARDIDKDGLDIAGIFEYLRTLGERRDSRLWPNGYLIFNRRITSPDFRGWHEYTGSNPHTEHGHVSFSTDPNGFDRTDSWGIKNTNPSGAELNAEESKALKEILDLARGTYFQIFTGEGEPGWYTWQGGTNEKLTLVDYNRRANVMLQQMSIQIAAMQKQIANPAGFDVNTFTETVVSAINDSLGAELADKVTKNIFDKLRSIS